jgi:hypothetical protein
MESSWSMVDPALNCGPRSRTMVEPKTWAPEVGF